MADGDPVLTSSTARGTAGARPADQERGLTGTPGAADAKAKTATLTHPGSPLKVPPAENWVGEIVIAAELFPNLFKPVFGDDIHHLRFQAFKKNYVVDSATNTIALARYFGVLQMDLAHAQPAKPYLWGLLRQMVESRERVFMPVIPLRRKVPTLIVTRRKGKPRGDVINDIVRASGLAFIAQKLAREIYGDLLHTEERGGFLSPFEDVSVLYLSGALIARRTLAHELLGHCYLACRRAPFSHPLNLKGYGILGSDGKVFEGTVIQFIERNVEASLG